MPLPEILHRLSRLERPEEVLALVTSRVARRGYDVVAIGGPHRSADFGGYFHSNWPDDWLEVYAAEGFFTHDPIPIAASLNILPVRWSDLLAGRAGFAPTAAQAHVLEVGAAHGYRDGVCVPVHGPGAYLAIGSYAGAAPDTSDEVLLELHLLTLHADARLSALGARGGGTAAGHAVALSTREIAALNCVLAGLTDAGAARAMGIGERTARFHIDNARIKLGATTRAQAVAAALALGLLSP